MRLRWNDDLDAMFPVCLQGSVCRQDARLNEVDSMKQKHEYEDCKFCGLTWPVEDLRDVNGKPCCDICYELNQSRLTDFFR